MKYLFITSVVFLIGLSQDCFAEEKTLPINLNASKIDIQVNSAAINTTASLKKLTGFMKVGKSSLEDATLYIEAKGSDVALGKLPIEQMFLFSGLLQAVTNDSLSFEGQRFVKTTDGYLLEGITTAGRNREKFSLPVTVKRFGADQYELASQYNRSGTIGNKNSAQAALLGTVNTRSNIKLTFGG